MTSKASVLVIEDEPDLRDGLKHNLELDGFRVDTAADGEEGLHKALNEQHDVILLDLMLPGIPGLEVLDRLRSNDTTTPVIILSAKGQDRDKVTGLDRGADDYLAKPFALSELEARIRAVLRRVETGKPQAQNQYSFDGLTIDFGRYTVSRDGQDFQLSRYEAEILRMLIDNIGQVVTRKDLLTEVWGYVHLPTTRTVDNHIARLRKKLETDVEKPQHVVTVHGIGYRFESTPVEC